MWQTWKNWSLSLRLPLVSERLFVHQAGEDCSADVWQMPAEYPRSLTDASRIVAAACAGCTAAQLFYDNIAKGFPI